MNSIGIILLVVIALLVWIALLLHQLSEQNSVQLMLLREITDELYIARRDKEVKSSTPIDVGMWGHSRPEIAADIYNKRKHLDQSGGK